MNNSPQSRRAAFVAYAAIVGVWLPFAVLLLRSEGNPEAYLRVVFGRFSRADAFEFVNRIAGLFFVLHTLLCVVAIAAVSRRRFDVATVLSIGPVLALLLYAVVEGLSDPAWYTIVALCSIGEMVAIVVGLGYWALKRGAMDSQPSHARCPRGADSNAN